MKRSTLLLIALLLAQAPFAGWAGGIKIPLPPVPIIVPDPPLFLQPPQLGFRVAVDTPYDLFIVDNRYYVIKDRVWFVGPGYNGPWQSIGFDRLPPGLRKHQLREIRLERDHELRRYREERDYDRRRAFRPERRHHDDGPDGREHGRGHKHQDNEKPRGKGKGGDD